MTRVDGKQTRKSVDVRTTLVVVDRVTLTAHDDGNAHLVHVGLTGEVHPQVVTRLGLEGIVVVAKITAQNAVVIEGNAVVGLEGHFSPSACVGGGAVPLPLILPSPVMASK